MGLVVSAVSGTAAWYLTPPPTYMASATLEIASSPKRIMWNPQDNQDPSKTFQKTQLALITNRFVLSDALSKPELTKLETIQEQIRNHADVEEWLKERLGAQFAGESEILELSLSGPHAEDLPKIVNSVLDSYLKLIVGEEEKERLARLKKLNDLWVK